MAQLPMDPQMSDFRCWEEEPAAFEIEASYQAF